MRVLVVVLVVVFLASVNVITRLEALGAVAISLLAMALWAVTQRLLRSV